MMSSCTVCAGWEMYRWDAARQSLRLSAQNGHPVFWWRYSHAARLLLLGTGDIGLWLQVSGAAS